MATAAEAIEQLKSYVQKPSETCGVSLYDHLTAVVTDLLEKQPADAAAALAEASAAVKANQLVWADIPQKHARDVSQAADGCELFKVPEPEVNQDGVLVKPNVKADFQVPDMAQEAELLEWAGVGISREEAFRTMLAVRRLGEDHRELRSVRFFGKILGTKSSYYVAEGETRETAAVKFPDLKKWDAERRDDDKMIHHNRFRYYVAKYPGAPWVQLPDVKFSQLTAAQKIRKYMTGSLDAVVESYPPFPGQEKHYLRAQLALMGAATVISPAGYFAVQEADEEAKTEVDIIKSEDFEAPETSGLVELSAWAHHYPGLPEADPVPEVDEEAEEDPDAEKEEPEDPEPVPLDVRPCEEEEPIVARTTSSVYEPVGCPVVLRNKDWPGAVTVALGGAFSNIYIGSGHPRGATAFVLPAPPTILDDVIEKPEVDDLKEQLNLGEDDEKKEGEEGEEGGEEEG